MGFEQIIGRLAQQLGVQDHSNQFNYFQEVDDSGRPTGTYARAEEGVAPENVRTNGQVFEGSNAQDRLRQLSQLDNATQSAHLAPEHDGNGQVHFPSTNELHLFSRLSTSLNPQQAAQYLQSCPETPGTDAYNTWITRQLENPPNPQTFERRIQDNQRSSLDANYRVLLGEGQAEGQANRLAQAVQPDQLAARSQQARLLVQLRAQLNVGTGVGQMTPEQFQQIVEANQVADASHLPSPQCNPTTVQAALREGQLRQRLESIYSTMEDGNLNYAEGTTGANRFMANAPRDLTARQAWVTERLAQLNANSALDRNALALLVVRDTPSPTTTEASPSTTPANSNEVQLRTQIAQITPHFTSEDTNTLIRLLPHPYGDPAATTTTANANPQQIAQSLLFIRQHPTRESFAQAILPQARMALVRQMNAQERFGWSENDPRIAAAAQRLFPVNNISNLEDLLAASRFVTNAHRPAAEETSYQTILSQIRNTTLPAEAGPLHVASPTENRAVRTQMDGYIVRLQTPPLDLHTQRVISDIFRNSNLEEMQRLLPAGTSTGELQHRVQQYLEDQTTRQVLRSVNGGEDPQQPSTHPLNEADARAVARQILSERFGGALPQASDQAFDFHRYQEPRPGVTTTTELINEQVRGLGMYSNVFGTALYQRTQVAAQQNATTQIASFLQREYSDHYTDAALARRDAVLYLHHANTAPGEARVFEHPGALQEIANTLESHERNDTSVNQTHLTNIQSFYGSTLNHAASPAYQALHTAVLQDTHYSPLMNVAQGVQASSEQPRRAHPTVPAEAIFVGRYEARGNNEVWALPNGSQMWIVGNRPEHPLSGTPEQVRALPGAGAIPPEIYNRIGAGSDVNSLVQAGILTVHEADTYTALHQEPAGAASVTPAPARGRHGRQATARAATPAVTPPEDRGPALLARMARGDGAARPEYDRYISEQTTLRFLQTRRAAGIEFGLAYRSGVARRALGTLPAPMPTQWPLDDAGMRRLAQQLTPANMPSQAQLELTRELLRDQEGARVAQQTASANAPRASGSRTVNVHTVTAPASIQGNADVYIRFTPTGRLIHIPAAPATHTPPPPPTAASSPWSIEGRTVTANGDITAYYKSGNILISVATNGRGAVTNPATSPTPAFTALPSQTTRVPLAAASTTSAAATTTPETPQARLTETLVRADAERHEAINNILAHYRSNRSSNVNTQGNTVPNPREQALRVLSQLHLIDEQGIPNPEVTAQQIREAVPHPENVTAPASDLQTFNTSLQSLRQSMGLTSSTSSTSPGAANTSTASPTSAGPGRFHFADLPPNATEAQIAAAEAEVNQAMAAFVNRRSSGTATANAEGTTTAGHQSLEQLAQSSTNPVSRGIMNNALAQTYVEGVHQYLTTHGFTQRNARAIEMHLGLVDNLEGHVPNSLNRDTAEAVFFRLNSATSDPQHLTPNDLVTNMISDYRQQNRDALVRLGFTSDEAARYLLARSELGENAMVNLANLAEDHARLNEATTSPSARTVFLNQARQAITNVNLPANGPISEQVAQLAETPAASATEGNNSTGNTAPRGGRQRGGAARGAAAAAGDSDIRGGNGRNRADANTLMNSQVTRERTAQEAENARRQSADTRRGQDLQLQGTRYQADRAYETEERRQEGEMIRSRLSNLNQLRIETLRVKAQMLQAMMQLLGQLISAAIGALAQVQAANISSVAQINAGLTQSRGRTA